MKRAFTLIELVVVVAILAVLSSLATAKLRSLELEAEAGSCRYNMRRIATAQSLYHASHPYGYYAGSLADLDQFLEDASALHCPSGGTYILSPNRLLVVCTFSDPLVHGSITEGGACSWQ